MSFDGARRTFRAAAGDAGARLETHPFPDGVGPDGEDLAVDVAVLGREDAAATLIVVSGTHGAEGGPGSDIQTEWLRRAAAAPDVHTVLVHALNPYGFAWHTRTTEGNVDLNRNFVDFARPLPANDAYHAHRRAIELEDLSAEAMARRQDALLRWIAGDGMPAVQRAITAGQYEAADGLFFGGRAPTWSRTLFERVLGAVPADRAVCLVDLHTGLGPRGQGQVIVESPDGLGLGPVWPDLVPAGSAQSVSAAVTGTLAGALARRGGPSIGVVMEFGTIPATEVLHALSVSNWVRNQASPPPESRDLAHRLMRDAFAPDDPVWRDRVTTQGVALLATLTERLAARG
ncbi:DUF2817 domain-containing protein [Azospirillum sp. ST 5-10]|uniref:DUF2817 domain-containing protein n=1 Tax=unclassified Azospirillum TaxID=2630922 RepID=UPI003F49FF7C